jgi:hypothetical protein
MCKCRGNSARLGRTAMAAGTRLRRRERWGKEKDWERLQNWERTGKLGRMWAADNTGKGHSDSESASNLPAAIPPNEPLASVRPLHRHITESAALGPRTNKTLAIPPDCVDCFCLVIQVPVSLYCPYNSTWNAGFLIDSIVAMSLCARPALLAMGKWRWTPRPRGGG